MSPTQTSLGWLGRVLVLPVGNVGKETLHGRYRVTDGRHPRPDAVTAHQAGHPVLPHPHAILLQLPMDPRAAIEATAVGMDLGDADGQFLVCLHPRARGALAPGVVAGAGDAVQAAHQGYLVVFPVCFDEVEDFRF